MTDKTLAWIGLGNMGMAMAANLAAGIKPAELKVFNRTVARSNLLAESSDAIIEVTTTLQELAAGSDIIFICLSDDAAVKSTIDTVGSCDIRDKIVCDMSTVHPDTTSEIANKLKGLGCQFVAAPVFGAPPVAVAGKLVAVTAGNPHAIATLEPFIQHMTRASLGLGDDPRLASLMKITGNTFILSMIETIAEGLVFSEVSGLGVDNTMKFISTILGGLWQPYAERMISGAYMPPEGKLPTKVRNALKKAGERPGFAVDVAHKDCSHALDLAKSSESSYSMNIMAHVQENLDIARKDKRFAGRGDVSSVYGVERERAGLDLSNAAVNQRQ